MKRYVIEREIPGVGTLEGERLKAASAKSNAALAELKGKVQWVKTFIVEDKTFCEYLADGVAAIHEHARLSGFPATKVTEVRNMMDPATAG